MVKRLLHASAVLVMLLFVTGNAPAAAITERETNDTPQQANPITTGATGLYHRNDQDWYKLTLPAASGALTYAVGRVFIQHFESGGTFLDFDPAEVSKYFAEKYEQGRKINLT